MGAMGRGSSSGNSNQGERVVCSCDATPWPIDDWMDVMKEGWCT